MSATHVRAAAGASFRVGFFSAACCALAALFLAIGTFSPVRAQVVTHWIMPEVQVPEVERPQWPNVFGTVALPIRARSTSTRWSKIMRASLDQPRLEGLLDGAHALSPEEQAAYVQTAVNHAVRSNGVSFDCSDDGYWAPAGETLARGMGDCFDIAVAKMEALRALGVPSRDLYLITGYFNAVSQYGGKEGTAALMVRIGDSFWLLTEQTDQLIACGQNDGAPARFTPYVTYGVGQTWIHGKVVKAATMAPVTGSSVATSENNRLAAIAAQQGNGGRRKD